MAIITQNSHEFLNPKKLYLASTERPEKGPNLQLTRLKFGGSRHGHPSPSNFESNVLQIVAFSGLYKDQNTTFGFI